MIQIWRYVKVILWHVDKLVLLDFIAVLDLFRDVLFLVSLVIYYCEDCGDLVHFEDLGVESVTAADEQKTQLGRAFGVECVVLFYWVVVTKYLVYC